jgi:hypothetical protein
VSIFAQVLQFHDGTDMALFACSVKAFHAMIVGNSEIFGDDGGQRFANNLGDSQPKILEVDQFQKIMFPSPLAEIIVSGANLVTA